jgi:WD40 repeat protein
MPLPTPEPQSGLIFLSHAGVDTQVAKELASALRQADLDVWLDADCLQPGDIWADELERALERAGAFVLYVGQLGVLNWVGREVRYALDRNTRDPAFRLIPILGRGAQPGDLPPFLRQQQFVDLREGIAAPQKLKEIVGALRRQPKETVPLLSPQRCPYRGLLPFEIQDALLFYGRDREISELLAKMANGRFLAVVGDSGSGKSSLVKAGLVPALHRGAFSFSSLSSAEAWRVVVVTPGDDPLGSLAEALPQLKPEMSPAESIAAVEEIKRQFAAGVDGLRNAIAGLQLPANTRPLLVIDQFEELFTLAPRSAGEDERDHQKQQRLRYVDVLLAAAAKDKSRGAHVVITLRADFYSQCWEHAVLPQRIAGNQFSVLRMNREQLRAAIEKPLALAGARAEPGLVEALLDDAGDEPGNLPLVEHALEQLWDERSAGVLTNAAYEKMGRLKGSLRNYAEQTYEALPSEAERAVAHKIFVRLTQLGEGAPDTRRRVKKSELLAVGSERSEAEQVLNKLASSRLITVSAEAGAAGASPAAPEQDLVEVAHEALIREWPRLKSWVSQDRNDLRVERSIIQLAAEWERYSRDSGALLDGARLTEAEEWAAHHPQELPASAGEFLKASTAARDEKLRIENERREVELANALILQKEAEATAAAEHRASISAKRAAELADRSRVLATRSMLILGIGCSVAIAVAWYALRQRALAESRQLAAQSEQDSLSGDPLSGLKLAIQAARRRKTDEAFMALDSALSYPRCKLILKGRGDIEYVALSPDSKRVVTAADEKTARVWDAGSGRPLATLTDHQHRIFQAVFSPDGNRVVTVSDDTAPRVWDAFSGRLVAALTGHQSIVNSAAFSPNGRQVVTASYDKTARVWDAESGRSLATLAGHRSRVRSAVFSSDGKRVVTASGDGTARVWDAESGRSLAILTGHVLEVESAAFSPDGKRVVTASNDGTARVWDAESGRSLAVLTGHTGRVVTAMFSPDGKRVVTAGADDNTARVWDTVSGESLSILAGHRDQVYSAVFSPDGKRVLTASDDKTARIWDAQSGRALATLAGHRSRVSSAVFSQDGQRVVTGSWDKTARIWVAESGRALATLTGGLSGSSRAIFFSPHGTWVINAGDGTTAEVWHVEGGRLLATLIGHQARIYLAAFSPDGKRVVTASGDNTARVWDAVSGQSLAILTGHPGQVYGAVFSPDGKRVVTCSNDRTARVWDAQSGRSLATLTGHQGSVIAANFSPDGKRVVTAGLNDPTARLWDAESGRLLATLAGHEQGALDAVFSPDGKRIATASAGRSAQVWDAGSGRLLATLIGHQGPIYSAVFSSDGKRVVTASDDKTARVWDAENGRLLATLTGHEGRVTGALFSPDGTRVVTGSGDNTARVWDAESGRLLATLTGHQGEVYPAVFYPDGKRVFTASLDGTERIYIVDFDDLLRWAVGQLPIEVGP